MERPVAPPPPADASSRAASLEDDPRRWWALAVLLLAQLMIILDVAIVNVALPSAQADLDIAPTDIQWVVTSYLLPFGGLLLLGGRVADDTGRKRAFVVATLGFAAASAVGGAANTPGVLFAARAGQGIFAAVMAPALLSILTLGFPRGQDRTRALALFGGVGAAGAGVGLLLGGLLTEYLSWRWSLLINIPLSLVVVAGAVPLLPESRAAGSRRYDVAGAMLCSLGLLGVIYGISTAADHGWQSRGALAPLAAGLVLLAAFAAWEARCPDPLLPLRLVRDRTRAGAYLGLVVVYGPLTGLILLLLLFFQGTRGESPVVAGLHFLPMPGFAVVGALISMRLLERVPPRLLLGAGSLVGAAGMAMLTRITVGSDFATEILPGLALVGLGTAVVFVAGNALALTGVPAAESGVGSAVINAIQQVGAALGAAVLSTVAADSAAGFVAEHGPRSAGAAIAHGNAAAFALASALMLATGLAATLLVRPRERVTAPAAAVPAEL